MLCCNRPWYFCGMSSSGRSGFWLNQSFWMNIKHHSCLALAAFGWDYCMTVIYVAFCSAFFRVKLQTSTAVLWLLPPLYRSRKEEGGRQTWVPRRNNLRSHRDPGNVTMKKWKMEMRWGKTYFWYRWSLRPRGTSAPFSPVGPHNPGKPLPPFGPSGPGEPCLSFCQGIFEGKIAMK